jgi:hypothetical protein
MNPDGAQGSGLENLGLWKGRDPKEFEKISKFKL